MFNNLAIKLMNYCELVLSFSKLLPKLPKVSKAAKFSKSCPNGKNLARKVTPWGPQVPRIEFLGGSDDKPKKTLTHETS